MTTLAADKLRTWHYAGDPIREEYPVVATDIIYRGAAVGENGSGYARPLVAADPFLGFAVAKVDNAAGAAGDKNVTVEQKGFVTLPISGLAITANDRPAVYASDDDTFTLTATSNSLIGYVSRWVSTGIAVVEFDAALARAAPQA
ncbi:MAG: cytoplasmic protein [Hyphomicrobiales bacterium]|nr:MAG: cytoplasmic protein [Hyphomicrobiales bacterium]